MEFNARYVLNGSFAVAVILAMFGFVYWLNNSNGFGERDTYQIRFTVPVSGLTTGSDVLFNGIKVGQVDGIHLDAARPGDTIATISVARGVPLRTDTLAGVDYAGLTGAASVMLTGGSAEAALLAPDGARPPVLIADPGESRSWTQKAGRILGVIDDVLENNKGRFDAILAGLERLAGGSPKEQPVTNDLLAVTEFPPSTLPPDGQTPEWQLAVAEPSVVLALNTDRVLQQPGDAQTQPLGEARWSDSLPNLFQSRIVQSFENAGYFNVLRPFNAPDPDYNLLLDIRGFSITDGETPTAILDFVARIIDRTGTVVAVRHFRAQFPADGPGEDAAIAALRTVFEQSEVELVGWTVKEIGAAPAQ